MAGLGRGIIELAAGRPRGLSTNYSRVWLQLDLDESRASGVEDWGNDELVIMLMSKCGSCSEMKRHEELRSIAGFGSPHQVELMKLTNKTHHRRFTFSSSLRARIPHRRST
jgi:hypothetical protein